MRRVYLRGHANIRKRLLIHTAGFNLGLLMRRLIGVGTPRGLQGRLAATLGTLLTLLRALWRPTMRHWPPQRLFHRESGSRSGNMTSRSAACGRWLHHGLLGEERTRGRYVVGLVDTTFRLEVTPLGENYIVNDCKRRPF